MGACFDSSLGCRPWPMLEMGGLVSVWVATEVGGLGFCLFMALAVLGLRWRLTIDTSKVFICGLFLVITLMLFEGFNDCGEIK